MPKDHIIVPAKRVLIGSTCSKVRQALERQLDRHLDHPLRLKDSMLAMEWKDECPLTFSLTNTALFDMVWRKYLIYVTDRVTALAVLRTGQPGHGRAHERRVQQATYLAG